MLTHFSHLSSYHLDRKSPSLFSRLSAAASRSPLLHVLKSILNTAHIAFRDSDSIQLRRLYVSLLIIELSEATGMVSGLKLTVVQPTFVIVQTCYVHAPFGGFAFAGPSAWMLCLWSFTQFWPSLNSCFIKRAYSVTAA